MYTCKVDHNTGSGGRLIHVEEAGSVAHASNSLGTIGTLTGQTRTGSRVDACPRAPRDIVKKLGSFNDSGSYGSQSTGIKTIEYND
jgi:hypothetical protein